MGGFCPGWFCPGGFCPGGFCPRGDFVQGDFVRGGFVWGDFVLEPLAITHFKWGSSFRTSFFVQFLLFCFVLFRFISYILIFTLIIDFYYSHFLDRGSSGPSKCLKKSQSIRMLFSLLKHGGSILYGNRPHLDIK